MRRSTLEMLHVSPVNVWIKSGFLSATYGITKALMSGGFLVVLFYQKNGKVILESLKTLNLRGGSRCCSV